MTGEQNLHEQPQHGGSYLRGKDGKLTRIDDAAPADAHHAAAEPAKHVAGKASAAHKKDK